MVDQSEPIKLVTLAAAIPFVQEGIATVNLSVRAITLNSVSFWRSEEGILFLRGYDEGQGRLVDLIASSVRFVA